MLFTKHKKYIPIDQVNKRIEATKNRRLNMLVDAIANKLPDDKYPLRLHSTRELEYVNNNPESIFNLARKCDWYITKKGILKKPLLIIYYCKYHLLFLLYYIDIIYYITYIFYP